MNCHKCGTLLKGTEQFCRNCGTRVNTNYEMNLNNQNYNMNYIKYNNKQGLTKLKYFLIGFFSAISLLFFLLVIFVIIDYDDNELSENNKNTIIPNDFKEDNKNYKIEYQGFTFNIPSNLLYKIEDDNLYISDLKETWGAYISVGEGSYLKLLNNKDNLPVFYQEQGFTTSEAIERMIDNTYFITMEFAYDKYNGIIAYTKASDNYIFGLTVYSYDNSIDYYIIEEINKILKDSRINDTNDDASIFSGLSLSIIAELGK